MPTIVHSTEAILALLERGLMPVTDNQDALLALGFERSSPHIKTGDDAKYWERSADHRGRAPGGQRMLVRERAVLEEIEAEAPSDDRAA